MKIYLWLPILIPLAILSVIALVFAYGVWWLVRRVCGEDY